MRNPGEFSLEPIRAAVMAGRTLDAWEIARSGGVQLKDWPKGDARREASILAGALGANRLSSVLDWLNWRGDRDHPKRYHQALFTREGRVSGSRLLPEIDAFIAAHPGMKPRELANLLSFQGRLLGRYCDFLRADVAIARSLELAPEAPWIHVEHSLMLEGADRNEEALEAADSAMRMRPYYRPGVLQKVNVLVHLGRDDEAMSLLSEAHEHTQNGAFVIRLQSFYSEREDHQRALWCLDRYEERSPLMEKEIKKWVAGRRADFLYMAGDIDGCLQWCDKKDDGFQKIVAENLRKAGARDRKRVRLRVPFVRQHRMTCAPATLAALAAYWGREHDHLAIADAICHEGTPWHKERKWAEEHGFVTREFRLTRKSLHELIDGGVPFTLTTQSTTSAHLQACIGYDDRAGVVLLRDPTNRHFGEMILEALIDEHPMGGPRAMILIPPGEVHRLEGITLPDAAAYDAHHHLLIALDGYDRPLIESALSRLQAVVDGGPLVLEGEQRVAAWRQDWPRHLGAIDAQLAIAPDHQPSLIQKCYTLRRLDRWQDLHELLERIVLRDDCSAVFFSELGELLMEDARRLSRAEYFLRKAVRMSPSEARVYESLARCRSKQLLNEEATGLRRIASCLAPGFEPYASGYFDSCRILRRVDEAFEFLHDRTRNFGAKDAGPWITLAESLNGMSRSTEASAVLERAVATRPEDGALRLQAGALLVGWAGEQRGRGIEWMKSSRGQVSELSWLREMASTCSYLGDRAESIRCWRGVLEIQPQAADAWRGLARMVAEEEGEDRAIEMLDAATSEHPELVSLWVLKAEWLSGTRRGQIEALNRVLALDPRDRWAWRERAVAKMRAGDGVGAEADAREALALNPWEAESHGILGSVLEDRGCKTEAAWCMRKAIELRIDYTFAATRLIRLAPDRETEMSAIRFIESEMHRQVSQGEIVQTYQFLAGSLVDPPLLLEQLERFCSERPDLWQTGAAYIEQALRMWLDEKALDAAVTLTEAFPLLPRVWLELARVHRAASRHIDEEKAAAHATELSPGWDEAARIHAAVLELLGKPDLAIGVLRHACQLDPLNGANHGCLADSLRRGGDLKAAFDGLRTALRHCPNYAWGWGMLARWAVADERQDEMVADLRDASDRHGHSASWWENAATVWNELGHQDEADKALRKGLKIRPEDGSLRDQIALQLCSAQRFEEALAACDPVAGEKVAPVNLQGRRAWILMRSGHPLQGIEAMKELIGREPDYAWGLSELAEWYDHRGEWKELRDICKQWSKATDEVRVLGYLGSAERKLGNNAAAKRAFTRAHARDPDYVFATRQLLDLQMIDGELDDAEVTLRQLEHYADGPFVTCDGIEFDLKREDVPAALRRAGSLLSDSAAEVGTFHEIGRLFSDSGYAAEWVGWLAKQVEAGPVAAPGALCAFLENLPSKRRSKRARKWIKREAIGSETRIAAWLWWISKLSSERSVAVIKSLVKRDRKELQQDGRTWNAIGEALLEIDAAKLGIAWFKGWEGRGDDATCATLVNLASLFDTCPGDDGRLWKQAKEVRREAFRRFPDASQAQLVRAGHVLDLAAGGDYVGAREVLKDFEEGQTVDYYRSLGQLAQAVVAAEAGDEVRSKERLGKAVGFLGQYSDLGTLRSRARAENAIASQITWAKGKRKRLLKKWELPIPGGGSGGVKMKDLAWGLLLVLVLIRSCGGAS